MINSIKMFVNILKQVSLLTLKTAMLIAQQVRLKIFQCIQNTFQKMYSVTKLKQILDQINHKFLDQFNYLLYIFFF